MIWELCKALNEGEEITLPSPEGQEFLPKALEYLHGTLTVEQREGLVIISLTGGCFKP